MAKRKKLRTIGDNPLDSLDESLDSLEVNEKPLPTVNTEDLPGVLLPTVSNGSGNTRSIEALFIKELDVDVNPKLKKSNPEIEALKIIKSCAQWSAVVGMVPVPLADAAIISLVQIRMIQNLCICFKVPFERKAALALVSSLLGGGGSTLVAQLATRATLQTIPLVGTFIGVVAEPAMGYATTFALGKTFLEHLKNDGTLNNIDPKQIKIVFSTQVKFARKLYKSRFKR